IAIFEKLGAAESKIHNIPIKEVHFHEVGAVDAMVDIVCAAVGAEALGVDEFVCSPLNVGGGTVDCAHGTFPVPAPATVELLKGVPVYSSGLPAGPVTPTGAAIVGTPIQMKTNRPGTLLTVLAKAEAADELSRIIFAETTTLGVRRREEVRQTLARRWETVGTKFGEVRIKVASLNGSISNYAPEYEDCRRIAEAQRV